MAARTSSGNFVIPIPLTGTRYVRGSSSGRATLASSTTPTFASIAPARRAAPIDEADAEPGFDGRFVPSAAGYPEGHFLGWTPGQLPPLSTAGLAWRLDPGSDLVVQLHLRPSGEAARRSSRASVSSSPMRSPQRIAGDAAARQPQHRHPGGRSALRRRGPLRRCRLTWTRTASSRTRISEPGTFAAWPTLPDGTDDALIHIRDWDFNWQDSYRFTDADRSAERHDARARFTYDNSAGEPAQSRPPAQADPLGEKQRGRNGRPVDPGRARTEADRRAAAVRLSRPKVIAEDAAGYEKMLEVDPGNAAVARSGRRTLPDDRPGRRGHRAPGGTRCVSPRSRSRSHYNLATALGAAAARPDEAEDHFRDALQLEPDHVAAHVNLGAVASRPDGIQRGRPLTFGALSSWHRTTRLRMRTWRASWPRRVNSVKRIAHYRSALEANPDLLEALTDLAWLLATAS